MDKDNKNEGNYYPSIITNTILVSWEFSKFGNDVELSS